MRDLVAVYGSLKQGFHNHRWLENAPLFGEAETPAKYTMYDAGRFPYLLEEGNTPIKVELYEVNDLILEGLDRLEGVKSGHYKRSKVETSLGEATIYVATEETAKQVREYCKVVPSGNWELPK